MERKNILKKGSVLLFLLLAFIMILPTEVKAAPKLNKKTITLLKGKSYTLVLKGTREKAKWKINKEFVAKFSNRKRTSVKIKAVNSGKAVVSAKVGKKVYKCTVIVVDPRLNKSKLSLIKGDKYILKVSNGTGKVTWKSNNIKVATVTNGIVTAKETGYVVITAFQNKRKLTCTIQVKAKSSIDKDNSDQNISKETEKEENVRKVWVVTEPTYTEFVPVYEKTHYIECLTCGVIFEGENRVINYCEHEVEHAFRGEEGRYSLKVKKVLIREDRIEHPEEGYWQEVYY